MPVEGEQIALRPQGARDAVPRSPGKIKCETSSPAPLPSETKGLEKPITKGQDAENRR